MDNCIRWIENCKLKMDSIVEVFDEEVDKQQQHQLLQHQDYHHSIGSDLRIVEQSCAAAVAVDSENS